MTDTDRPTAARPRITCAAVWNGCLCERAPHRDDRHVWRNTLDGYMVDPALYPWAAPQPDDDGLRRALYQISKVGLPNDAGAAYDRLADVKALAGRALNEAERLRAEGGSGE